MLTRKDTFAKVPTFALEPLIQILGLRPEARKVVQALASFSVYTGELEANPPCRINTGFTGIATGGLRGKSGSQKRGTGNGRRVVEQNEFRTVGQKHNDLEFSESVRSYVAALIWALFGMPPIGPCERKRRSEAEMRFFRLLTLLSHVWEGRVGCAQFSPLSRNAIPQTLSLNQYSQ